jgi:hypothetical protein
MLLQPHRPLQALQFIWIIIAEVKRIDCEFVTVSKSKSHGNLKINNVFTALAPRLKVSVFSGLDASIE